jgi:hypothetical protein
VNVLTVAKELTEVKEASGTKEVSEEAGTNGEVRVSRLVLQGSLHPFLPPRSRLVLGLGFMTSKNPTPKIGTHSKMQTGT